MEFPFMKQNNVKEEHNIYRRWGFECSSGWYELLRNCCQQITDRYAEAGVPIDFVPAQIKEKFGTLRFYYGYEDAPCGIAAIDNLWDGTSIRFEPGNECDDEEKKKLRHDIAGIVRVAEERSKHTCEICSKQGIIRTDLSWIKTLCDSCYDARKIAIEEKKKERAEKAKEIYEEIQEKKNE
ncbi:MAG: hypothetical protein GX217_03280 [Clostridiaceae bacterium]|jgi:hypothetical protein|nr:hypothetical protein [Clostridiaceae bacterium]